MKIYDCFTFYNEFELLELRLKALWNVVDYFVLVEANKTHTNNPKPFYFWEQQDDFKEFFPKIRHLPVEMTVDFSGVGDWSIENAQRDAIAYGLEDAAPDDLIMISDLDEIPAPEIFQRSPDNQLTLAAKAVVPITIPDDDENYQAELHVPATYFLKTGAVTLEQTFHYYYFDWVSEGTWFGTALIKRKNLTTPQDLRNTRYAIPRIPNGGHHFSYMGGADRVIDKMTSIVDGNEFVVQSGGKLIDKKHVEQAMANGTDIYNRKDRKESQFIYYDARNIKLPHIEEFLRKYPHFLREPEKYFGGNNFHGGK